MKGEKGKLSRKLRTKKSGSVFNDNNILIKRFILFNIAILMISIFLRFFLMRFLLSLISENGVKIYQISYTVHFINVILDILSKTVFSYFILCLKLINFLLKPIALIINEIYKFSVGNYTDCYWKGSFECVQYKTLYLFRLPVMLIRFIVFTPIRLHDHLTRLVMTPYQPNIRVIETDIIENVEASSSCVSNCIRKSELEHIYKMSRKLAETAKILLKEIESHK